MAAPVSLVGRCRFALKSSQILLLSRSFASRPARIWRRIAKEPRVNVKRNDNVYLMSYRDPPKHSFTEAMSCLRAYDIPLTEATEQIIELYVRIDMGEKKVSLYFGQVTYTARYSNINLRDHIRQYSY